jgi:LysM domain-containing protein
MPALGFLTLLRGCLALALCGAGAAGAWGLAGTPFLRVTSLLAAGGPSSLAALPLEQVLAGLCATVLLGGTTWLLGSTALVALTRLVGALTPGSALAARCARAAERCCPGVARAAVVTLLGLTVGTTAVGPALADSGHAAPGASPGVASLTGLPLPDRAIGAGPATPAAGPGARPRPREVVVRPGDSLWSIAEGLLGPAADDVEVTAAWHRLHRANLSRVDDPDLIRPGQHLVVPAPIASRALD